MSKIYFSISLLLVANITWGQSIFSNVITDANPSASNPYTNNQTFDGNLLSVSGIGRGTGINASAAVDRYNATAFTTATTIDLTDYFEFILTPKPGFKINFVSFVYNSQRSNQGTRAWAFRSSVDNYATNIGTPTETGTTISLSGAAYQNFPVSITFRFYGFDAQLTSGTFSVNDFIFNGTVVPFALPISLQSFAGQKEGTGNKLRWTTSNEQNNLGFEVQRSADGVNYSALGFVNSQATGGNSSGALNYSYIDNSPVGIKQYYRLRQVDIDGGSKVSTIVLIKGNKPALLAISSMFPNPAISQINVLLNAAVREKVTLVVMDATGKSVIQKIVNVEAGSNTVPVDISRLKSGNYLVKLVCSTDCETMVSKFVKQ